MGSGVECVCDPSRTHQPWVDHCEQSFLTSLDAQMQEDRLQNKGVFQMDGDLGPGLSPGLPVSCELPLTLFLGTQPTSGCSWHSLVSAHLLALLLSPQAPSCHLLLGKLPLLQGLDGLKLQAPDSLGGKVAIPGSSICPPRTMFYPYPPL